MSQCSGCEHRRILGQINDCQQSLFNPFSDGSLENRCKQAELRLYKVLLIF